MLCDEMREVIEVTLTAREEGIEVGVWSTFSRS